MTVHKATAREAVHYRGPGRLLCAALLDKRAKCTLYRDKVTCMTCLELMR